ncbi:hypothetical protein, partial [Leptospira perolatii]|uniref:hypothetical protein n=1 Tax=Leptospira perolatii TaxID=2023191 RepID=UPI001A9C65A7
GGGGGGGPPGPGPGSGGGCVELAVPGSGLMSIPSALSTRNVGCGESERQLVKKSAKTKHSNCN